MKAPDPEVLASIKKRPRTRRPKSAKMELMTLEGDKGLTKPPQPPQPRKLKPVGRKKAKPKPKKKPVKMVGVTLQLRHHINGETYGPGDVRVSETLAQHFQHVESEAGEKELSLLQQRAFIIIAGPYGVRKQEVPWARFNEILERSEVPLGAIGG